MRVKSGIFKKPDQSKQSTYGRKFEQSVYPGSHNNTPPRKLKISRMLVRARDNVLANL
jgi:hypothetical protein